MKKILWFTLLASAFLAASSLQVHKGSIKAHTEVFGDSTIDPVTTKITSKLHMSKGITSIRGDVKVGMKYFVSDNEERDEHMYEALDTALFPVAVYTVTSVEKAASGYIIHGVMKLHGISKALTLNAQIEENGSTVHMRANGSFLLTSYGIKPPKLLFLTVRDRIDLSIDVTFKKR